MVRCIHVIKSAGDLAGYPRLFPDPTVQPNEFLLFRGQSSTRYKLRPKVGRSSFQRDPGTGAPHPNMEFDWRRAFEERFRLFEQQYYVYHRQLLPRRIDRFFLAQHYGLATQLLDWTLNPLVALYFACASGDDTEDGIVFVLLNRPHLMVSDDIAIPFGQRGEEPEQGADHTDVNFGVLQPMRFDQRMENQDTIFTVHGKPQEDFGESRLVQRDVDFLRGMLVPRQCKRSILMQLANMGIDRKFIFPGLDSLCDAIDRRYSRPAIPRGSDEGYSVLMEPHYDDREPYMQESRD